MRLMMVDIELLFTKWVKIQLIVPTNILGVMLLDDTEPQIVVEAVIKIMKKFTKIKEDFICDHCQHLNVGDGFTNHCSECFYSKHVDIFPGDRRETCQGLMKPIGIEKGKGDKYIIIHQCQECFKLSRDKFREDRDNFDRFLKLVEEINRKKEI